MNKIGDKITLNLEFEVVESNLKNSCIGCYGYTDRLKCTLLTDNFGSCIKHFRPDKKNVIYKLIEKDETISETNH